MIMSKHRTFKLLSVFLSLALVFSQFTCGIITAHANSVPTASGENWLKANQKSEGYWGSDSYTGIVDTSEILDYFTKSGHASDTVATAKKWLNTQVGKNLNYEARMLPYMTDAAKHKTMLSDLANNQNNDGGWGVASNYSSDALDTVVILSALMKESSQNTFVEEKAVAYLISQQNSDGGWSYISGDSSNISLTSQILMELYDYSETKTSAELITALSSAKSFLISNQLSDKTWGTDESSIDDTLYAYRALMKTSNGKSVAEITSKIAGLQNSDGSWNDNIYTTVLALEALSEPQQSAPVINSIKMYKISAGTKTEMTNFEQHETCEVDVNASFDFSAYSLTVSILSPDASVTQLTGKNGEYKFSIGSTYSGNYTVKVCIKDSSGNIVAEQDKAFSIKGMESVTALTLYKIKDGSATECYSFDQNENMGIAFTAKYDSKNETISVSVKKPDGTEIPVHGTGSFTWDVATNEAGSYFVIVRVLDQSGKTVTEEEKAFTIKAPAQIAAINSIKLYRLVNETQTIASNFNQNETVNISVDASYNRDSETMNVSVAKPDGTIDICTNKNGYSWSTGNNEAGEYAVIVQISDNKGNVIVKQKKAFSIEQLQKAKINSVKIVNSVNVETISFNQNESVNVIIDATYNGAKDTLGVSVKRPDGTVKAVSNVNGYVWNTGNNKPGNYLVIVQLKNSSGKIIDELDKQFTINSSFIINSVYAVSDLQFTTVGVAENINILVPVTYVTNADKTVDVNVSVYDASGKSVFSSDKSLKCSYGQTQAITGSFQFTPDATSHQTYTIKATVIDGKVQIGSAQTTFEVRSNKITSSIGITQSTDKTSLKPKADSVTETLNITGTGTSSQPSRKPLDLVLCIDDSGSMESTDTSTGQERIKYAEIAAQHIIDVLGANDKGGVVEFAGSIWTQQSLTTDKQILKDKIASTPASPWDGTAIGIGIQQALNVIESESDNTRQKAIVVISDGGETSWNSSSVINEANTAFKQGCKIYTLGLGKDADINLMSQIAQTAGGTFTYSPTADQLDSMMQEIAGQIFDAAGSNAIVKTKIPKSNLAVDTSKIIPAPASISSNNDGSLSLQWNLGKVAIGQTRNITIPFSGSNLTAGTNFTLTTNTVLSYSDANNDTVKINAKDVSIPVAGTISGKIFKQSNGKVLVWTDNDADNALAVKTLTDMGIGYTLVKSKSDFSQELNTRSYSLYLLMGNRLPLSYNDEKTLLSEIQNGKGVLNDRDANNDTFNSLNAYKVKYRGYNTAGTYKIHFQGDSLFGETELDGSGQTWYFENLGGSQQAELWMPQAHTSAVMFNQYGKGKTAAFAFDLGAETGRTEYVLNKTIQYLAPGLKAGTLGNTAYTIRLKSDITGAVKIKCTLPQGAFITSMSNNGDIATGIWTMDVQKGNVYELTLNAVGTGTLDVDIFSESNGTETKINSLTQTMGSSSAENLRIQQLHSPKTLFWAGTDRESAYAHSVLDTMSDYGKIVHSETEFLSELSKETYDELVILGASPSASTQKTLIQYVTAGKSLILACNGNGFTNKFEQMLRVKFKNTVTGDYFVNLPSDSIFDQYDKIDGSGEFYLFDNTGARGQGNLNSNLGGTFAAVTNSYGNGKTLVFGCDPSGLSAQSTQVLAKAIDRLAPHTLADKNTRVRISFTAQSAGAYTILPDLPQGDSIVSSTFGQPGINGWIVNAVAGKTYTIDAEVSCLAEGTMMIYGFHYEDNGDIKTETSSVYLTK